MNEINIQFYTVSLNSYVSLNDGEMATDSVYINTTPLYLNSYIKCKEPELHPRITWQLPMFLEVSAEELIDTLVRNGSNLLMISLYVWNLDKMLETAKQVKHALGDSCIIVAGGPSCNPHGDADWFERYPFLDYSVYSQGELAFASLIKHLLGVEQLDINSANNLARKGETSKFKLFRSFDYSPYLESKEMLIDIAADLRSKNKIMYFPFETSRGCPYTCSFCDWTGGLSTKVAKFIPTHVEELTLLKQLGIIKLHLSDANIGQWDRDLEVVQTIADLSDEGDPFSIASMNLSKLNKKNAFKILDIFAGSRTRTVFKVSLQDIDSSVLANIQRPDVPWDEHKIYIRDFKQRYPDVIVRAELIQGLPGQTVESWIYTLRSVIVREKLLPHIYTWMAIPNSPLMLDEGYRNRFQIEIKRLIITHVPRSAFDEVIDIASVMDNPVVQVVDTVIGTSSYSTRDFAKMTAVTELFKIIAGNEVMNPKRHRGDFTEVERIYDIMHTEEFEFICKNLAKNIDKGILLFGLSEKHFITPNSVIHDLYFYMTTNKKTIAPWLPLLRRRYLEPLRDKVL